MRRTIVLDAGHGGNDPGTSTEFMTEKQAALETVLTIKYVLADQLGLPVALTRAGDTRPAYAERQQVPDDALAYVSVHYNMPRSYGLVYYQHGSSVSLDLARILAQESRLARVWTSRQSNHNGLYIDHVPVPAVMLEVAEIDDYPLAAGPARDYRMRVARSVARALIRWAPPS